ncbi:MAG: hypothetical protein ABH886_09245 [Candidatus Desantisbacteria bacterium]
MCFKSLIFCGLLIATVSPVWGGSDGINGKIGAITIGTKTYYEVNIQPEFVFGQLKLGLDVPLRWNDEDGIRKEDWDGKEDISTIIRYIQWAEKKATPLYLRVGNIDTAVLGNGYIVRNYANIAHEDNNPVPYKRSLGSTIDFNFNTGGIETLVNDVISPRLYGMRCYIKPLVGVAMMKDAEVGFTYVTDTKAGTDTVANKKLTVYGMDCYCPVFKEYLAFYGDYADIKNAGNSIGYGIKGGFGPESFRTVWGVGHREQDDNFIYGLFDSSYEVTKPIPSVTTTTRTKVNFGNLNFNILQAIVLGFGYDDAPNSKRLTGQLAVDQTVMHAITKQRIGVNAFYDQKNIKRSKENTTITTQINYGLSDNVDIIYSMKKYYDGAGKSFTTSNMATAIKF